MKKITISVMFLSGGLLLGGCGGESPISKAKKAMEGVSQTVDVVRNVSKSTSIIQESMDKMEQLKDMTPASKEELKSWLPENIGDFKRKAFSIGDQSMADISSVTGSYKYDGDENKTVEVSVIDGAGAAGGMFAMVYAAQFNRDFEEEHEDGFSKSMEKDNRKAVVSQDNRFKSAKLEFLEGGRYYVKVKGENMVVEELWDLVSGLKTNMLPGL